MPWKNKEAQKAYSAKYYQENKDWLNKINHEATKRWIKENPERWRALTKAEYLRNNGKERTKNWRNANKDLVNDWDRKRTEALTDSYLLKQLSKLGWDRKQVIEHPEIIDLYRQTLKIKRELK